MERSNDLPSSHDNLTTDGDIFIWREQKPFAEVESEDNIELILRQLTDSSRELQSAVNDSNVVTPSDTNDRNVALKDPPDIDEIFSTDEKLITPTSHNVSILNSACQQVLKEIERQLLSLLKKNRKEQEFVQNFLDSNGKCSQFDDSKKFMIKCCGVPYFKDLHGFMPPPNEDTLRKQNENKLMPMELFETFPKWNSAEAKILMDAASVYNPKSESIDWLKISVTDLKGKYSPSECKSKWYMNLNLHINRSKWNLKEMKLLKALCEKYKCQNWDDIAEELGTDRTALQCCIQYMTHTFPSEGKWTEEEDQKLENLIEKFRIKDYIPWPKVVWYFEDRSLKQCQERYAYHLVDFKKGTFTADEDFLIAYLAPKLKNFGQVAKYLPNRVATQLRSRFEYLVELSMPNFTREEDELLNKLMTQYPRNWKAISSHFRNRSRLQCRKRWASLQRKIKNDLHVDGVSDESGNEDNNGSSTENEANFGTSFMDTHNFYKNHDEETNETDVPVKQPQNQKKSSEAYHNLLEYYKNCYKFLYGPKPRSSNSPEDLNNLVEKMKVTMKSLSVEDVGLLKRYNMASLSENCEFDQEDLDVLAEMRQTEFRRQEVIKKIIPPNFMTLVGLRSFILNWLQIKALSGSYKEIPESSVSSEDTETDSNGRILCGDAKNLFKARLKALFAYPLIFLNILPENLKPEPKPKVRKTAKPLSRLKRRQHARLMNAAYKEKLKTLNEKELEVSQKEVSDEKSKKNKSKANPEVLEKHKNPENESSRKRTLTENEGPAIPLKRRASHHTDS